MKKIIGMLIVIILLLISNKVFALILPCINTTSCSYSCGGNTYNNYNDYQKCTERERIEKEKLESEVKQKVYKERKEELSQYSNFFDKVGVNLTLDTDEEQYNQWLKELKEAKVNYIKEQENLQKIKELEERIKNLESKPIVIEKVITHTEIINTHNKEDVIKPTINDSKIIKPVIKKEETKKEIIEEKPYPTIETTTTTEPPIIPTNKSFFQRVFDWFKSLF